MKTLKKIFLLIQLILMKRPPRFSPGNSKSHSISDIEPETVGKNLPRYGLVAEQWRQTGVLALGSVRKFHFGFNVSKCFLYSRLYAFPFLTVTRFEFFFVPVKKIYEIHCDIRKGIRDVWGELRM